MKTVFNTREVAHIWANQSQDSARNGGNTFFFHNTRIFSYGHHFEIARLYPEKKTALFNPDSYSVTTSKHQTYARGAIRLDYQIFEVPILDISVDNAHRENLNYLISRMEEYALKAARARTNTRHYLEIVNTAISQYSAYCETFKVKRKPLAFPNLEKIKARAEKQRKAEKARAEKARAELIKQQAENVKKWRNGERVSIHYSVPVMLRINGDTIETSKGASFPVDHAKKAYRIIKRLKESGKTYQHENHTIHLGNYRIDKIDRAGNVTAGCHYVEYSEIKTIGEEISK